MSTPSIAGAPTWSEPVDISGAGTDTIGPEIAATPEGTLAVSWCRRDGDVGRAQVSIFPAGVAAWSPPVDLAVGTNDCIPHITATPDGGFAATWYLHTIDRCKTQVSTLAPGGGAWSSPVDLFVSDYAVPDRSPKVAATDDGTLAVIWHEYLEGGLDRVRVSTLASGAINWSAPSSLGGNDRPAHSPQIVAAPGGKFVAAWSEKHFGTSYVKWRRSHPGPRVGPPRARCPLS